MRGLFFKIFIIFWIAQSLIFVISTGLILHHRMPGPRVVFDPFFGGLRYQSKEAAGIYESGGCDALRKYAVAHEQNIALVGASGSDVCTGLNTVDGNTVSFPDRINGQQAGNQYIWSLPVVSAAQKNYIFLLIQPNVPQERPWYKDMWFFAFPQLPVAIAIGGLTTFVLVLVFTRPVIRLRKTAGELAHGNLKARVKEPARQSIFFRGDEFHALTHDFNHMAERLDSLVDAQRLLLRDVSHELRSPLARLSVALELAREDGSPEMENHLNRMERETEKLNLLIGQLLTLSSMEAIDAAVRFDPVSLNQLVEQMIPDAQYEASHRPCSVVFHAGKDYIVQANRQLLYRAIENVLRNAIQYTGPGTEVVIAVAASPRQAGQPTAIVEVSDRGPGIPDSELGAIFRPFHRVDRARSQETGGFGVGLAIAERAVKLHGGEMRATNRDGGGAIIRMQLPLAKSGSQASENMPS